MAELSTQAEKLLSRHLKRVGRELRRVGIAPDEAKMAVAATEEQAHAVLDATATPGPASAAQMQAVLDGLDAPEGWADAAGHVPGRGLALTALVVTFVTLALLALAGVFSHMLGGDGGATWATIGLFGFLPAMILGILARRQPAGRAAVLVSGFFVGLFLLAWGMAMLIQ